MGHSPILSPLYTITSLLQSYLARLVNLLGFLHVKHTPRPTPRSSIFWCLPPALPPQVAHDVNLLRSLQGWLGSDSESLRKQVRGQCGQLLRKFRDMCVLGKGQNEAQVARHQAILRTVGAHVSTGRVLPRRAWC